MIVEFEMPEEDPRMARLNALVTDQETEIEKLTEALCDRETRLSIAEARCRHLEQLIDMLAATNQSSGVHDKIKELVDESAQKDVYIASLENKLETLERAYEEAFGAREI